MRKIKVLLTGSRGLVGSSFIQDIVGQKPKLDSEVIKTKSLTLIRPNHVSMDVSKSKHLKVYIERFKPDVIVHFAAHRNANSAEEQRGDKKASAWISNVKGTRNISELSQKHGIYLIHISTDMVFSGHEHDEGPYSENQLPKKNLKKLSWYGWTKLLGEKAVGKYKDASIIRIANVTKPIYDPTLDYVGKILWLYDQKKLYPIFSDQTITLTYIPDITRTILALLKKKVGGVYHVASSNLSTPYEVADYLLDRARGVKKVVQKSSLDEFLRKNPNRYPKFGGLKSKLTQERLGIEFPTWQKIVDIFIDIVDNNLSLYGKNKKKTKKTSRIHKKN